MNGYIEMKEHKSVSIQSENTSMWLYSYRVTWNDSPLWMEGCVCVCVCELGIVTGIIIIVMQYHLIFSMIMGPHEPYPRYVPFNLTALENVVCIHTSFSHYHCWWWWCCCCLWNCWRWRYVCLLQTIFTHVSQREMFGVGISLPRKPPSNRHTSLKMCCI